MTRASSFSLPKMFFACLFLSAYFMVSQTARAGTTLETLRIGASEQGTRVVVELSQKAKYEIFTLNDPYRVVIDIYDADWPDGKRLPDGAGLIQNIRKGLFSSNVMRIVMDTTGPVNIARDFVLPPSAGFPYRMVIDLAKTSREAFIKDLESQRANKQPPTPETTIIKPPKKNDKFVVVIDAGHGGVDPGASGKKVKEKDVVLAFAKELAAQLRRDKRYQVYLTRDRDVYIPLRERVNIARRRSADLFISIHADAIGRKNVRGMSIYTLSETASDKEAEALARKENRSDIIAGIDFGDQPKEVTNILIDLAQRETKNLSVKFASTVVSQMKGHTVLLDRTHRFAGFRVLKAPDVPSVLIELGFLTNSRDEKQLVSTKWRKSAAVALKQSIDAFSSSLAAN